VLHGGAKLSIFQLQSWSHGQGCKLCGRCLAGAAAKASEGLLTGYDGRFDGFQKLVKAVLRHVSAKGALRSCDGGHIGRVCGALICFPQSVRYVVQGLPLLAELSTLRAFKRPKGGGPSRHDTLGCGGGREVCCSPFKVVGMAEAEAPVVAGQRELGVYTMSACLSS
jgi:hypothetical protein